MSKKKINDPENGRQFSKATVMQVSDLNNMAGPEQSVLSLTDKENLMMENRCTIFIKNYEYLLKQSGLTQAQFCREMLNDYPSPQLLAGYKKARKDIPLRTMIRIAAAFDKTLEEMTGTLLDGSQIQKVEPADQAEFKKYCGVYDYAYFSTSSPLGENFKPTPEALNYAVITICAVVNEIGSLSYRAYGLFHCTEAERQMLCGYLKGVNLFNEAPKVQKCYQQVAESKSGPAEELRVKYLYAGSFRLDKSMAEITMNQVHGEDVVHIRMHNRAAKSSEGKKFSGGMAVMMSSSRGEEHMPCVQAGVFSAPKYEVQTGHNPNEKTEILLAAFPYLQKEQLAEKLYMTPPKVTLGTEAKDLLSYIKMFLDTDGVPTPLTEMSDDDKQYCVETYIEKKLTDVLRRNILSYYKLSLKMDSEVYKMLKMM